MPEIAMVLAAIVNTQTPKIFDGIMSSANQMSFFSKIVDWLNQKLLRCHEIQEEISAGIGGDKTNVSS